MRRWHVSLTVMLFLMWGCATVPSLPPQNTHNLCALFSEHPEWYKNSRDTYERWGMPIAVQAAIIYQESAFRAEIKPPHVKMLGLVPIYRPSTAYGYAQVIDGTWRWYQAANGKPDALRYNFADATDFIGWYGGITAKINGVSKGDAYHQYLAYHEGHSGFKQKTYEEKEWLLQAAQAVEQRATQYQKQLERCEFELEDLCCGIGGLLLQAKEQ